MSRREGALMVRQVGYRDHPALGKLGLVGQWEKRKHHVVRSCMCGVLILMVQS
jgi:hypothetical protein